MPGSRSRRIGDLSSGVKILRMDMTCGKTHNEI